MQVCERIYLLLLREFDEAKGISHFKGVGTGRRDMGAQSLPVLYTRKPHIYKLVDLNN